ncbi:polysaccharide biosynthesis/export family protein [candidate division KSB1 bacterium]|nr:polysaccharide biosynthesis/export family protein [candidate division KSB1 bacterium]
MKLLNKIRLVKIISLLILISFISTQTAFAMQTATRSRYNIFHPGDAIQISIMEIMDYQTARGGSSLAINDTYSISRKGVIFMPLVGEVKVVGHNEQSLTEELAEKFSPYFKEPFITVIPMIRVTLMGAFNKPGSYRIDPNESLWELIDMADGPDSDCDLESISVKRGGELVIENLLTSFEKGYSLEEIGVRSGDQIIAEYQSHFGLREILDWAKFGITLVVLYLQIQQYSD